MNILFLTIGSLYNIEEHAIYTDLLRSFRDNGHEVYSVSTYEKRFKKKTDYSIDSGIHTLRVKVGNLTKCNIIEKGISTVMINSQYRKAIKKYLSDIKFDLVLYSTPPVTLVGAVKYVKRRDNARTYLLLKDIFPQNAVDIGMMTKSGIKGFLYKYFRNKEKKLYAVSDKIGCMSQANVDYVLKHNKDVSAEKVEICPNCIEVQNISYSEEERIKTRDYYGIPQDKKVFVYGGNLGRPQSISFIVECLKACADFEDTYFLIIGNGTDRYILEEYIKKENPSHVKLLNLIPNDEYNKIIACCDVGLIFLDYRFTIPNFPSRLLSYMQVGIPVLASTDKNTDIGKVVVDGGFGWSCESNNAKAFSEIVANVGDFSQRAELGKNGLAYLKKNYTTEQIYKIIIKE